MKESVTTREYQQAGRSRRQLSRRLPMNRPRFALLLIVIGAAAGCHFGPPHTVPDDAGPDDQGTQDEPGGDDVGTPDDSGEADARPDDAGDAGDADEQG